MSHENKIVASQPVGLTATEVENAIKESILKWGRPVKRVLLVPPDISRLHSGAGKIACEYFRLLSEICEVAVLPALGTHEPMTEEEAQMMFPSIPYKKFFHHDWRDGTEKIGSIPASFIEENSAGWCNESLPVRISRPMITGRWDLVISIGQVVPHEVAGMANYTKNIVIGCGGKAIIDHSHMLSAIYGIEETLGKMDNPVRALLDYAQEHVLTRLPLMYVLTVTDQHESKICIQGMFFGARRKVFESAVKLSEEKNIFTLDKPIEKAIVYLDPKKFKTTWLGNKAIYRTRMAMADEGELVVLAPGVRKFGEDEGVDSLIRKYGYVGREKVLKLTDENEDLKSNMSVAAHLIHGSSEGRFKITYAVDKLSRKEVESVGYEYLDFARAVDKYPLDKLKDGFNTFEGEEVYFISNPAAALWRVG